MKIKYPVKSTYVREWTVRMAIRELIANGLDAKKEHGSSFHWTFNSSTSKLTLVNLNIKLQKDALYFGGSEKATQAHLIGRYGEGLKLALLVLLRAGREEGSPMRVKIFNNSEIWTPCWSTMSGVEGEFLAVEIKNSKTHSNDLRVVIEGVTKGLWDEVRTDFIELMAVPPAWSGEAGALYTQPELQGRVYVQGVYCSTDHNLRYGYNLKAPLDTGRDRKSPGVQELRKEIAKVLLERRSDLLAKVDGRTLAATEYFDLLSTGKGEAQALEVVDIPSELQDDLVKEFKRRFGEEAVPASNYEMEDWRHIGRVPVNLSASLQTAMYGAFPSLWEAKMAFTREVLEEHTLESLTDTERQVYNQVSTLLSLVTQGKLAPIKVVTFRDSKTRGLWMDNVSHLSRKVLANLGDALVTAIHEEAHRFGGDGTQAHVRRMESLTSDIFTVLLGALLRKEAFPQAPSTPPGTSTD